MPAGHVSLRHSFPSLHGRTSRISLPRVVNGYPFATKRRTVRDMWTIIVILLIAWAVLSVVGFAIKGLFWLAIIGIILFIGTVIFGLVRQRRNKPEV